MAAGSWSGPVGTSGGWGYPVSTHRAPDHPDDRRDREMLLAYWGWLRRLNRVTREAVAEHRGVSTAAVAKFEAPRHTGGEPRVANPPVCALESYAEAIGCRVVALVEGLPEEVDADPAVQVLAASAKDHPLTVLARLVAARRLLGIGAERMGAARGTTEGAVRSIETAGGGVRLGSVQSYARTLAELSGLPIRLKLTLERAPR